MGPKFCAIPPHPRGEAKQNGIEAEKPSRDEVILPECDLVMDTPGGRFRAQFDDQTPVSPLGPLVFFAQFLQASGRFEALCADQPLDYRGPNAPSARDVIGTLLLGILAGHWRYAHLSALRFDVIAPELLGLGKLVSEDSVRRGLRRIDPLSGRTWLLGHLGQSCHDFLDTPWILDIDVTIKPIYGRQEGASLGYNPQKPGRPSHAYHTYWIATLRLCLDVEVHPGNQSAAGHGLSGLWILIDGLPIHRRPHLLRGDCAYGQEDCMLKAEQRSLSYLFKLRRTKGCLTLIGTLERDRQTRWEDAGQGWQGTRNTLRLQGWSRERDVVVLRRRLADSRRPAAVRKHARQQLDLLVYSGCEVSGCEVITYEYQILITNLPYGVETLAPMYRARGDAENPFDELKNQWGWGGFTTQALASCQHTARLIALVYNWWSVYGRLLSPGQHHEAITSRPRLLGGVARQTEHAGQRRLNLRLLHAEAPELKKLIIKLVPWLQGLLTSAEQLCRKQRWEQIVERILRENFGIKGPAPPGLPAPA
jgi:Transposase DDE domain group 1